MTIDLSIYKISEAIATSLSVEKVIDLVLDAALVETDADVANLLLERPHLHRLPGDPPGRAYRQALSHATACGELKRCSGSQFDPEIVLAFLSHIEEHRKAP